MDADGAVGAVGPRRHVDHDRGRRVGADRQPRTGDRRRRAEAGPRLRAARAQYGSDVEAAADGEVAPERAGGRLDGRRRRPDATVRGARSADVATTAGPDVATSSPPSVSRTAASGGLPTSRLSSCRSGSSSAPDERHADGAVPGPAPVLHGRRPARVRDRAARSPVRPAAWRHEPPGSRGASGPARLLGQLVRIDEPDGRAGRDQRGRLPLGVPEPGVRVPEEVPTAGRRTRVHGGVRVGDGDRAGGHTRARRGPPREVQRRVEAPEVGEAGGEPAERAVVARRVCRSITPATSRPQAVATSSRSTPS